MLLVEWARMLAPPFNGAVIWATQRTTLRVLRAWVGRVRWQASRSFKWHQQLDVGERCVLASVAGCGASGCAKPSGALRVRLTLSSVSQS